MDEKIVVSRALLERIVGSHYKKQKQFMRDKDELRAILAQTPKQNGERH